MPNMNNIHIYEQQQQKHVDPHELSSGGPVAEALADTERVGLEGALTDTGRVGQASYLVLQIGHVLRLATTHFARHVLCTGGLHLQEPLNVIVSGLFCKHIIQVCSGVTFTFAAAIETSIGFTVISLHLVVCAIIFQFFNHALK
jgi:hypothetical protein